VLDRARALLEAVSPVRALVAALPAPGQLTDCDLDDATAGRFLGRGRRTGLGGGATKRIPIRQESGTISVAGVVYGIMYGMRKTTVYLPDALKARLERVAAETHSSEAEIIREAIDRFTGERERPRPKLPLFESGQVGLAEDVDEILAQGFGQD
jgi:Arc/MetJ-type ribon-helix-helix transcriptional regulator